MRYTPFESMDRMLEQMRREMADWRENAGGWPESDLGWSGRGSTVDLTEHDEEYVLTVDMPGFEPDEIDAVLDGGHLTVSAVHTSEDSEDSRSRSISERITLPKEIVEDDASATYRNGVLEVHLPIAAGANEHGHRIDVD